MVCLGNICRSPLAEGIMQRLVKQKGLDWQIDSAGTGSWYAGEGPDSRSIHVACNEGIDISGQICRQFKISDFDNFDLILVMDRNNLADVLSLARNSQDTEKVKLLLGDKEIPDPYCDDTLFGRVFKLIEKGCKDIIKSFS